MQSSDITTALGVPEILKLKQIGTGIEVQAIMGRRLLIEAIEPETREGKNERAGLLYLPDTARDKYQPRPSTGIILLVGQGVEDDEREFFKEGAMILFSKFSGMDVVVDEREGLKILETRDVAAILKPINAVIAPIAHPDGPAYVYAKETNSK